MQIFFSEKNYLFIGIIKSRRQAHPCYVYLNSDHPQKWKIRTQMPGRSNVAQ